MVNLLIIGEFAVLCHDCNSGNQALLIAIFIFIIVIKLGYSLIKQVATNNAAKKVQHINMVVLRASQDKLTF